MRIGMFEVGMVALAAAAVAVVGAGWTVVDADPVETAGPIPLEVERLAASETDVPARARDLLSDRPMDGTNGSTSSDPGDGENVFTSPGGTPAPDAPVETWMNRAVAADPFRPDRRPGPGYTLPWERRSWDPPEVEDEEPPEMPEFRVVGIVVPGGDRGGAALIQREGEQPRLYRVGERVGGYELTDLAPDVAVLDGPAGVLNFMVDQPYADDRDDRRRRRGGDDDERRQRREEALRERELQRARQQVIDAIRRRTGGNEPLAMALPDVEFRPTPVEFRPTPVEFRATPVEFVPTSVERPPVPLPPPPVARQPAPTGS